MKSRPSGSMFREKEISQVHEGVDQAGEVKEEIRENVLYD